MTLNSAGRQDDGSIIDIYGNKISQSKALQIIEIVNALPAQNSKEDILHTMKDNPIVIVQGATGSGKSTQLPKFVHFQDPKKKIVVTQPRVFSATSLAARVAMETLIETGDPRYSLGHNVGYRTGRGKNATHETKIAYHTDGTEFMRQSMSGIEPDVLVLDEAHGYSVQTEMLAMSIRKAVKSRAMQLVIMSATLDPEIFREYYRDISSDIPLIEIPGRTFGVESDFDRDGSIMNDLRNAITAKQNVLIFAPGKKEIQMHIEAIKARFGDAVEVCALHAEMSASEQNYLLTKTTDKPRIIVSTNVAEESITIPYIDLIMDLGTQKVLRHDRYGIPTLGVENTAYANAKQREGRVGRTKKGFYNRYNPTPSEDLDLYPEAPIEREMIDRHILTLLSQGVDIIDIIYEGTKVGKSPFFHHVDMGLFDLSLERLRSIGALTPGNKLTVLGHELLKFPIDVYHARMLYESIERGCVGNIIPLVAILEKKGMVSSKEKGWQELISEGVYTSDLDMYIELLNIVTTTTLSKKQQKKLIELGIDSDEIKDFVDREGTVKLYEIVDLSSIGIKNKTVKEIDECRKTLTDRCIVMGIDIASSTDLRTRSTCITTGYLHNQYVYDSDIKKFSNISHGQYGDRFKQGDVSLLEAKHKAHYLGVPFIIKSTDDRGDLHIITQLIAIDKYNITAALQSNVRYAQEEYIVPKMHTGYRDMPTGYVPKTSTHGVTEVGDNSINLSRESLPVKGLVGKKSAQITRVLGGDILIPYDSSIQEFQITRHASSQDAQDFYLKYCLIPLLFEHNSSIRKYIYGKDQEWLQFFAELLKRFIGEYDLYRINPDNVSKTETSFKHDSSIMMRFQESNDPVIRNFRLHGVPAKITRILPNIAGQVDTAIDTKETDRIAELKNTYAKLLGQSRQYVRTIPLDDIANMSLERVIRRASEGKGNTGSVVAYAELSKLVNIVEKLSEGEIRELSTSVKGVGARKNEYHKYELIQAKIKKFNSIFNEKLVGIDHKKELIDAMNNGYFGLMSKEEKTAYLLFVERITSVDDKKRKRAINNQSTGLKRYQSLIASYSSSIEKRMNDLRDRIHLNANQVAKDILENLGSFTKGIFKKDYAELVMLPKTYGMMRTILRDSITEKKGLKLLLSEGFAQKGIGQHMNATSALFDELVSHDDLQYTLDEYREAGAVYKSLLKSNNPEEIAQIIEKLEKLIHNLGKSVTKVDNNTLWQDYCTIRN